MPSTNSAVQTAARDMPTDPGMLVDVVVLSGENALFESIRRCVGERNLLWRAHSSEEAVDMLATMPALADAMVTHRFSLDDAPEAFRAAADRQGGAIKILLQP